MSIRPPTQANSHFNPKRTTWEALEDWAGRHILDHCAYRPSKFLYDIFKLLSLYSGKAPWAVASERVFRQAANGSTVMRFFHSLFALKKAWSSLDATTPKRAMFFRELCNSFSLGLYTGLSFTGKIELKIPAVGVLLLKDSLDLYGEYQERQELERLSWLEINGNDNFCFIPALKSAKTHQLWKIAKAVLSIVLGILVLIEALFLGISPRSTAALTGISIGVSVLSMRADYYRDQKMPFSFGPLTGWPTIGSPRWGASSPKPVRQDEEGVGSPSFERLPQASSGAVGPLKLSPQSLRRSVKVQKRRK